MYQVTLGRSKDHGLYNIVSEHAHTKHSTKDQLTSERLPPLPNILRMERLNLRPPRLLLRLDLNLLHLLTRLPHLAARQLQRAIGVPFRGLSAHHPLARLHDAGVELLVAAAAAELVQQAAAARGSVGGGRVAGLGRAVRRGCVVGGLGRGRWRGRVVAAEGAEEALFAGRFLILRLGLGLRLAGEERHGGCLVGFAVGGLCLGMFGVGR